MATVRSFIALDLPPNVKQTLADVSDRLSSQVDGVRWVRPENLHLTLKFLGNVESDRLAAIGETLGPAADTPVLDLSLGEVGAFPRADRARVIWVGLEGQTDALRALQAWVGASMAGHGFEPESRAFRPHLTLGRARSGPVALPEVTVPDLAFEASQLMLMQSELRPGGARYTPLTVVQLAR